MAECSYVRAVCKTGVYIAELLDIQEEQNRALVKIVAVLKHPTQGDLHNPRNADVPYFHQRKALSEFEKAWAPLSSIKKYEGDIPPYKESLRIALQKEIEKMEEDQSEWATACLVKLRDCQNEYGL